MARQTPTGAAGGPSQGVVKAAKSGDRLTLLLALRARLAQVIDDGCSPRDLVGISRRLLDVAHEIETLTATDKPALRVVDDEFDADQV